MGVQPQDLLEFTRSRPFQPFRLTLTDGRSFEVHHPELIMVGRTTAQVGLRSPDYADVVYERSVTVSLLHVMQLESLPRADAG